MTSSRLTPIVMRRQRGKPLPPNTVYVGRPTVYGNPFVIGKDGDREQVIERFAYWISRAEQVDLVNRVRRELAGKNLACWCAPERCHADVLLRIAND